MLQRPTECKILFVMEQEMCKWLKDHIPVYLARRQDDLKTMKQALSVGDLQVIQNIGHNMKGTGSAYGLPKITEIGLGLEVAAKRHDATQAAAFLQELESYFPTISSVENH